MCHASKHKSDCWQQERFLDSRVCREVGLEVLQALKVVSSLKAFLLFLISLLKVSVWNTSNKLHQISLADFWSTQSHVLNPVSPSLLFQAHFCPFLQEQISFSCDMGVIWGQRQRSRFRARCPLQGRCGAAWLRGRRALASQMGTFLLYPQMKGLMFMQKRIRRSTHTV